MRSKLGSGNRGLATRRRPALHALEAVAIGTAPSATALRLRPCAWKWSGICRITRSTKKPPSAEALRRNPLQGAQSYGQAPRPASCVPWRRQTTMGTSQDSQSTDPAELVVMVAHRHRCRSQSSQPGPFTVTSLPPMRAVTVVPPRSPARSTSPISPSRRPVRRAGTGQDPGHRRVRHRPRDHRRRIRLGPARRDPPRHRPRIARRGPRGPARQRAGARATWWWPSCAARIRCPCPNCAIGEWDMCRNGQYTEWGIKEHHGYARERYRITPDFVVKVDPTLGKLGVLLEPTTVVAKAWDHIERIGARAQWQPGHGPDHRGRPDRPAGRPARRAARPGRARPRPGHRGAQARAGGRPRARRTTTARSATSGSSPTW